MKCSAVLNEDEQSGVEFEDPSPRPHLIRDSSVNRSAAGAFNSVALENAVIGVKRKVKEYMHDFLGWEKDPKKSENTLLSNETTLGSSKSNIASDFQSGSSSKQGSQRLWNRLSSSRSSMGFFNKLVMEMITMLCLLHVFAASGDSCIIERKDPGCYGYFPYRQEGVPYMTRGTLVTFPGEDFVLKLKWTRTSKLHDFDCGNMTNSDCVISTIHENKTNTCQDLTSVSVQPNGTGYQVVTALVTEVVHYCVGIDMPGYFGIHQVTFFPTTNPSASHSVDWKRVFVIVVPPLLLTCFGLLIKIAYDNRRLIQPPKGTSGRTSESKFAGARFFKMRKEGQDMS